MAATSWRGCSARCPTTRSSKGEAWARWIVDRLLAALGPDFAADGDALRRAAHGRGSWNIFYLPLFTKIDLFILGSSPFDQEEFARRRPVVVRAPAVSIVVKSPEDTVLRKLLWYRSGGGVSQKQWRDLVEVLRVSGAAIDGEYLERWASRLGLTDLLEGARTAAREPRQSAP